MTIHSSPSEAALGEIPVTGLHANFALLSAFNDAVGKEVLLELVDGSVFTGIFGGASSEMEVGLYCAYERTAENEKNLLPLSKDIVKKRQFAFSDIVCVTVPTNDEKMIRGFATDRDYHKKERTLDDGQFEAWEGDGEDVDLESDEAVKAAAIKSSARNGGWGVNEMFAANQSLGVKTTFEDNLSQYTTAEVEGTDEDRRRADEIARQIEKSGSSRMYSALENDDEERDLDKITEEADLLGYESKKKLVNRGVNNNGRGGSNQMTPKNNRAEGLKAEPRRVSSGGGGGGGGGGGAPVRGPPIPSPKGGGGGGQGGYVKRDSYDGPGGQGQGHNYDSWNTKGGMKTFENTKMRDQKMMLENRIPPGGSPRNTAGQGGQGGPPPSGPSTPHNQKGGASGRVEGLKAWQNDFNYKDTRPVQKGPNDKMESHPQPTPLLESVPPTKNAWQSGPPSGLTSSSRSEESKSGGNLPSLPSQPSPSTVPAPTPAETQKMTEEKEGLEETVASTSHDEERTDETNGGEKEDADVSKDSTGKKFSFNPDAPAFTPKFGGGGGASIGMGGGMAPTMPQTPVMIQSVPLLPQGMPIPGHQGQMGGMGGMQQTPMIYQNYPHPHYQNIPQNMANVQYTAVVNGGAILPGAAQNGQGQTGGGGGGPPTPRGVNGGQGNQGGGAGMGQRPGQRPTNNGGGGGGGPQGGGGGTVPVTMPGGAMYIQQAMNYPAVPMAQQNYMQPQANYYPYNQAQMIQGGYPMQMQLQQQALMGQPQRGYVPQPNHQTMMLQYSQPQQQQYAPPPGMNPQQGGGGQMGSGPQGGQATPSQSNTNGGGGGGPPNGTNGAGGQGGAPSHPPSQPPTPGAQTGGMTSQTGMIMGGGPPPVYGMYPGQQVVFYPQGSMGVGAMGEMGGAAETPEGGVIHPMYQYNAGQYYQNAPPHLMRGYPMNQNMNQSMNQSMQQQPQHAPAQPSQSQN